MNQYPCSFEFHEGFLRFLSEHSYASQFGKSDFVIRDGALLKFSLSFQVKSPKFSLRADFNHFQVGKACASALRILYSCQFSVSFPTDISTNQEWFQKS